MSCIYDSYTMLVLSHYNYIKNLLRLLKKFGILFLSLFQCNEKMMNSRQNLWTEWYFNDDLMKKKNSDKNYYIMNVKFFYKFIKLFNLSLDIYHDVVLTIFFLFWVLVFFSEVVFVAAVCLHLSAVCWQVDASITVSDLFFELAVVVVDLINLGFCGLQQKFRGKFFVVRYRIDLQN